MTKAFVKDSRLLFSVCSFCSVLVCLIRGLGNRGFLYDCRCTERIFMPEGNTDPNGTETT